MNKKEILKAFQFELAKNTSFDPVIISVMVDQLGHALSSLGMIDEGATANEVQSVDKSDHPKPIEDDPRIDRIRRKFAENPEACHVILNMLNQVTVREDVSDICNDENHSPYSMTDAILDYLNIPQDLVVDKKTDNEITKRVVEEFLHDSYSDYPEHAGDVYIIRDKLYRWLDKEEK